MDDRWVVAAGLIAGGIVVGALAGWMVRRRLDRASDESTPAVAGVAGLFVFAFLALIGVLFAVALVRPESLEDLPRQVLDYSPRLLVAGFILIAGYAAAVAASRVVAFGIERASGRVVLRLARVVKWAIFGAVVILALAQLSVDTTILILLAGVLGFGVALSVGLLVGLGGRDIAREIAAGRYLARFVTVGAAIEAGREAGRVAGLHPATIELETADGRRRHVAYSVLLENGVTVEPPSDDPS